MGAYGGYGGDGDMMDDVKYFKFEWTGQVARFSVKGGFSYSADAMPEDGIVREEHLRNFDISIYDPDGALLRTYEDNRVTFPEFNFAYDTASNQVLTAGLFDGPEGINVGEKTEIGMRLCMCE